MRLAIALLLFIISFGSFAAGKDTSSLKVLLETAPILNTKSPIKVRDLQGKIVLVDFWTYGCINCQQVIPDLKYLENKYASELVVLGVHSAKFENEKGSFEIKKAVARYGINHPVINDSKFEIWNAFGVTAWPTLVLIDPDGKVAKAYSGEGHRGDLDRDIFAISNKFKGKISNTKIQMAVDDHKMEFKFPSKISEVPNFSSDGKSSRAVYFLTDSSHHQIVGLEKNGKEFLRIGNGKEGLDEQTLSRPQGVAFKDGLLYIADTANNALRTYDFKTKKITTVAGDGSRGYIWASPWALAVTSPDEITVAMAGTHQLAGYNTKTKQTRIVAGSGEESINDGPLPGNSLSQPSGLSLVGNKLYFVDAETSSLRVLENGKITTLIGKGLFDFGLVDGDKSKARMQHTTGVYATADKVYLADTYNNAIRVYDVKTGKLTTLAKGFKEPNDILLSDGKLIVVSTGEHSLKKVDVKTGKVEKFIP
jgi:thiol-disulfide isomerase/thioredoxin